MSNCKRFVFRNVFPALPVFERVSWRPLVHILAHDKQQNIPPNIHAHLPWLVKQLSMFIFRHFQTDLLNSLRSFFCYCCCRMFGLAKYNFFKKSNMRSWNGRFQRLCPRSLPSLLYFKPIVYFIIGLLVHLSSFK